MPSDPDHMVTMNRLRHQYRRAEAIPSDPDHMVTINRLRHQYRRAEAMPSDPDHMVTINRFHVEIPRWSPMCLLLSLTHSSDITINHYKLFCNL